MKAKGIPGFKTFAFRRALKESNYPKVTGLIVMFENEYHPVIQLPNNFQVFRFDRIGTKQEAVYGVGRYAEKRPGMYAGELYSNGRDFHIGIDLGAPAGTPVYAFDDGEIFCFQNNSGPLDYGPTLVTKHRYKGKDLFVLLGHLSTKSLERLEAGTQIDRGQVIGWVGQQNENGGWYPHVHVQCSWVKPKEADMPGVILEEEFDEAQKIYPDPRIILGPLY